MPTEHPRLVWFMAVCFGFGYIIDTPKNGGLEDKKWSWETGSLDYIRTIHFWAIILKDPKGLISSSKWDAWRISMWRPIKSVTFKYLQNSTKFIHHSESNSPHCSVTDIVQITWILSTQWTWPPHRGPPWSCSSELRTPMMPNGMATMLQAVSRPSFARPKGR